jgi:hypothetical protein
MDLPPNDAPPQEAPPIVVVPADRRLSLARLVAEARNEFLSADHGFFYTTKELLVRPGLTMAAVWRGEHQRYTGPFRFFMFSFTLYALVWISTGAMARFWDAQRATMAEMTVGAGRGVTPDLGAVYLSHPLVSEFGTIFAMWLSTWIWFRGLRLNAAERAALPLYWYGLMNLVQVPLFWFAFTSQVLLYAQLVGFAGILFVAWGSYTLLEPRRWWNALRGMAWWLTGAFIWAVAIGFAAGVRQGFNAH